jgi:hypothetical protein
MTKDAFRDPMQELIDKYAKQADLNKEQEEKPVNKASNTTTLAHTKNETANAKNSTTMQKVEPKKPTEKPTTPQPGNELKKNEEVSEKDIELEVARALEEKK